MVTRTDVIIVGGGLSGLALADHLQQAGIDYHVYEARARLGGRIKTGKVKHGSRLGTFDLGPAWFWPGQPRMRALVDRLGLVAFDQHAQGILSYEDESGAVMRGQGYAAMQGSYRITGGMSGLIDRLSGGLDPDRIHIGATVGSLRNRGPIEGSGKDGSAIVQGRRVVLALPPRVSGRLGFEPALPEPTSRALRDTPTWMGGQAKVIAVYESPFWREAGLSGDAMSRAGPMVEIHDATDPTSGLGGLFGFVGVPAQARVDQSERLRAASVEQLVRLFGPKAQAPVDILLQDWALEAETATEEDHAPISVHPAYGLPRSMLNLWEGRLLFGSSEVAPQFGGYLEGALDAAEQAATQLLETPAGQPNLRAGR